jgi:hypothetical protein
VTKIEERIFDIMKRAWTYGSGWMFYATFGQEPKWHKSDPVYYNWDNYWCGFKNALAMLHPISFKQLEKKFDAWANEFIEDRNNEGFIVD